MRPPRSTAICLATAILATTALAPSAFAQRGGFNDPAAPTAPNQTYQGSQGFSSTGDELPPSYDRKHVGTSDPRYSQTVQQQKAEAEKPGGGCLRYGLVGAAGGHLAGHGVMGALAGCATGAYVRHRDKARIRAEQTTQQ